MGDIEEICDEIAWLREELAEAERLGDHAIVARRKWFIARREETLKDLLRMRAERFPSGGAEE